MINIKRLKSWAVGSAVGSTPLFTDKRRNEIKMLLLVLPFLIFIFIFSYLPLLGWSYAFCDYRIGIPILKQHFVGLKYFKMMLGGVGYFTTVLRNTLVLSGLGILCSPVAVIFAIMLSRVRNGKVAKVIQTITSFPNFISWILVYALFFALFNTNDGAINILLLKLHLIRTPTNILANAGAAWYFQTAIGIWKGTGWSAIIYIAAMSGIDQELYDAADVDGAGNFQKILHITVPGLLPTYFVLLMLSIASILNNGFDQYWVFQNSLVTDRLEVLDTYIYRIGIQSMQYSYSTAMGMAKSLVSVLLLTFANRLSKAFRGESIF